VRLPHRRRGRRRRAPRRGSALLAARGGLSPAGSLPLKSFLK
jgi:hypothetical protein